MDFYVPARESVPLGLAVGKVVANYDEKHKGMVQVAYYTYHEKSNTTAWVRVVSPAAGNGRGMYFLPEVGDAVVLAFLGNDANHPCVIGALWHAPDTYPENTITEENNHKAIITKSGIQILLSDEKDKECVTITTPKKAEITLSDAEETITIKDGGGKNKIVVNGKDGQIDIVSDSKLTIKSKSLELSADNALKIKANNIDLQATNKLTVEGTNADVKANGGVLNLKGAMVKING